MTEQEWLTSGESGWLLHFLRGRAGERKLQLLAVACCRSVLHHADPGERREALRLLRLAEAAADGTASDEQLTAVPDPGNHFAGSFEDAVRWAATLKLNPFQCADDVLDHTSLVVGVVAYNQNNWLDEVGERAMGEAKSKEEAAQSDMLRDIFGNPFRPVTLDPSWRTSTAVALASQMYDSRDFSAMPILADALQDAGCCDEEILTHCRGDTQHVRGCWVVDLVLGKA